MASLAAAQPVHVDTHHDSASATRAIKASGALQSAKQNLNYLIHPDKAHAPARFRTRAFLRTVRYISVFIFWRLVRYAKYVAIGSATAALAGTAIGSIITGAGFIIAPTGIFAGAGAGLLWGMGKFGWRILGSRVRTGTTHGADPRADERMDAEEHKTEEIKAPRADPW